MSKLLDLPSLENWLWEAACTIRGPVDAPKFKDYILPLVFLKRLSDVFEDEIAYLAHDFGDRENSGKLKSSTRLPRAWGSVRGPANLAEVL